jgi:hypothetical protein
MRRTAHLGSIALSLALLVPLHAHAAPPSHRTPAAATRPSVAFTRDYNVFLMPTDGGTVHTVTTRGSMAQGIQYPWYQWSHDGKYLLLERGHLNSGKNDLLLMSADGTLLRTLQTGISIADFPPTWADDADQIAYIASQGNAGNNIRYTIDALDVTTGKTRLLFTYSNLGACGGGTTDPAQQLFWAETGLGGVEPRMQWSVGAHTAIYSWECGNGLRLVDLQSGHVTQYDTRKVAWAEGTRSATGQIAAIRTSTVPGQKSYPTDVVIATPSSTSGKIVAQGELPTWSPDGKYLYFEQRTPGKTLLLYKATDVLITSTAYTSAIWRADADGTHLTRLFSQDAYAFGPLRITSDGTALIFTRIDNATALAAYMRGVTNLTPQLEQRYGPFTAIERLDLGTGQATTIAARANRPAVQPATP